MFEAVSYEKNLVGYGDVGVLFASGFGFDADDGSCRQAVSVGGGDGSCLCRFVVWTVRLSVSEWTVLLRLSVESETVVGQGDRQQQYYL